MLTKLSAQVESEAFCLLRLCADLTNFIRSGRTKRTYLYETEELLEHILQSLEATERFVRNVIEKPPEDDLIRSKLRDFGEIKKGISWLYILAKEAIDSDSLSIPFSLATFLNHTVGELLKPKKASLVVLSGSNLMYYKYNLKAMRDLTRYLSTRIEDYPELGEDIGILMFPYCASREVLVNCNLFHEMGHYIYESTSLEEEFSNDLVNKLAHFLAEEKIASRIEAPLLAWRALRNYVLSLMLRWSDEIFADIFVIRVLGPAFHFAYREIEHIIPTTLGSNFSETHPADDYRFQVHTKWLINDGWSEILRDNLPGLFKELEKCKDYKIDRFSVDCRVPSHFEAVEGELHKWMLAEFNGMVNKIEDAVSAKLGSGFKKPIEDYNRTEKLVTSYLAHGIVPSTLYDDGTKLHPYPVTVLNCGFLFYLKGMTQLLERVKTNLNRIDKRIMYEKRLNSWLGKAIEDWQILLKKGKL
jgi:hypothetical protein